jgi:hypothetical protein
MSRALRRQAEREASKGDAAEISALRAKNARLAKRMAEMAMDTEYGSVRSLRKQVEALRSSLLEMIDVATGAYSVNASPDLRPRQSIENAQRLLQETAPR